MRTENGCTSGTSHGSIDRAWGERSYGLERDPSALRQHHHGAGLRMGALAPGAAGTFIFGIRSRAAPS